MDRFTVTRKIIITNGMYYKIVHKLDHGRRENELGSNGPTFLAQKFHTN